METFSKRPRPEIGSVKEYDKAVDICPGCGYINGVGNLCHYDCPLDGDPGKKLITARYHTVDTFLGDD